MRLSGPKTEWAGHCGRKSSDLWTGSVKKTALCEALCGAHHAGLEASADSGSGGKCSSAEQRGEAGSGLSHHATGFGVSLGKEPWASKVSETSLSPLTAAPSQKPVGAHLCSRVPSARPKHRFSPNFHLP